MCGIVGLFFKRGAATQALGPLLAGMLSQMRERGPDSTGFALYGEAAHPGLVADMRAIQIAEMNPPSDKGTGQGDVQRGFRIAARLDSDQGIVSLDFERKQRHRA